NANNAMAALVDVVAVGAKEVWVEHGDSPAYGDRTRGVAVPTSGSVVVPVIGLSAGARAHYRVHAIGPGGKTGETPDLTSDTQPLPEGVPCSIEITTPSVTATGFFLVGLFDRSTKQNVATMIDRRGRVRWYWVSPNFAEEPEQVDRIRGNFLVVDGK